MKILKNLRNNFNLTQKELANKLAIEQNTLSQYEADYFPSFKVLNKISEIFKVSLDYLINENMCFYPRSLDFMNLSNELDNKNNSESKSLIEKNISNLIQNISSLNIEIKQDKIPTILEKNFHSNLKSLRILNNITQKHIAEKIKTGESVIGMYERKNYPTVDKMIKLSEILNCSIHALVTGQQLSFNFKDKNFCQSILIADHLLSIEDKNFLIKLMKNIIDK